MPVDDCGANTWYSIKGCRCLRCSRLRAELQVSIANRALAKTQGKTPVNMNTATDIRMVMDGAPECVNKVLNDTQRSEDARIAWVRDLERRVQALEAQVSIAQPKDSPNAKP